MILQRTHYWERIAPFFDKPVIKIITGMRRVGKSCLLRQIRDKLAVDGVEKNKLLWVDKESLEFDFIQNYHDLNDWVLANTRHLPNQQTKKYYLFIDEIQEIQGWEIAIASFHKSGEIELFITGSNAHLLSSELATYIAGRYVEFVVYPLSFKEHLEFSHALNSESQSSNIEQHFLTYLRYGGLPGVHYFEINSTIIYQFLNSLYDSIMLKDIVHRHQPRNIQLIEKMATFLFDNVGNIFSVKSITNFLKSQKINCGHETLSNYLTYFCNAFLAYKVPRYDLRGKRLLETFEKYYVNDLGIRHAVLGYKTDDIGKLLENLVYIELRRRNYTVSIGKLDEFEIDFIAEHRDEKHYYQVAYLLPEPATIQRELAPLQKIKDNYPKTILSLDKYFPKDHQGIKHENIVNFLLGNH